MKWPADKSSKIFTGHCPVCGGHNFDYSPVLWDVLLDTWQITTDEAKYVNRQQVFFCIQCNNNLRAMGLSAAMLRQYKFDGTLAHFCETSSDLKILEINTAGNLKPFFMKLPGHKLIEYPQFDMMNIDIEPNTYDLVIHSDTLEHVPSPERGLSECLRVLRTNGYCIFTVPIIVNRMTRSRIGLTPSYHG